MADGGSWLGLLDGVSLFLFQWCFLGVPVQVSGVFLAYALCFQILLVLAVHFLPSWLALNGGFVVLGVRRSLSSKCPGVLGTFPERLG